MMVQPGYNVIFNWLKITWQKGKTNYHYSTLYQYEINSSHEVSYQRWVCKHIVMFCKCENIFMWIVWEFERPAADGPLFVWNHCSMSFISCPSKTISVGIHQKISLIISSIQLEIFIIDSIPFQSQNVTRLPYTRSG